MKVLFVASECAPIAKVGGLGDVIGSLPKALGKIGVDARVAIPFYEEIKKRNWETKKLGDLIVGDEKARIYTTKLPGSSVEVFLIYNEKYLSRGPIYFEKTAFVGGQKEIDRFLFFSKAAFQILKNNSLGWRPDIVHCNDWHSGALVKMLQEMNYRTVFTIHNLANQGKLGDRNLMAEGIQNADRITTVSPTYAKEILTKEYGDGLEGLLRKRKKDMLGILNGVDYGYWPNKGTLRQAQGKFRHQAPKFGFVARLTDQKGLNLILPLVPKLVEKEKAEFSFLGQGQENYERALRGLAKKYPRRVRVEIGFDEKRAHRIYAESDFFLMPSLFEPSGLGQMISMHYGTIPVVRATGGLKDSVKHLKTGFVFREPKPAALLSTIETAIRYFQNPKKLAALRANCLKEDFSWTKSAKEYKKLYEDLLE